MFDRRSMAEPQSQCPCHCLFRRASVSLLPPWDILCFSPGILNQCPCHCLFRRASVSVTTLGHHQFLTWNPESASNQGAHSFSSNSDFATLFGVSPCSRTDRQTEGRSGKRRPSAWSPVGVSQRLTVKNCRIITVKVACVETTFLFYSGISNKNAKISINHALGLSRPLSLALFLPHMQTCNFLGISQKKLHLQ